MSCSSLVEIFAIPHVDINFEVYEVNITVFASTFLNTCYALNNKYILILMIIEYADPNQEHAIDGPIVAK